MSERGQHVAVEDGAVPSTSRLPMPAERCEPGFGELRDGLLRAAIVDPVASCEIGFDRCPELDGVCLLPKGLLALASVDAIPHVVSNAGFHLALVDARHHTTIDETTEMCVIFA